MARKSNAARANEQVIDVTAINIAAAAEAEGVDLAEMLGGLDDVLFMEEHPVLVAVVTCVIGAVTGYSIGLIAQTVLIAAVLTSGSLFVGVVAAGAVIAVAMYLLHKFADRVSQIALWVSKKVHAGVTKAKDLAAQLWAWIKSKFAAVKSKVTSMFDRSYNTVEYPLCGARESGV